MTFYLYTLGCKVNQYESECILQAWESYGLIQSRNVLESDILIINSCAVTDKAVKDTKKLMTLLRNSSFRGQVIITGCAIKLFDTVDTKDINYITVTQEEKVNLLTSPHLFFSQFSDYSEHKNQDARQSSFSVSSQEEPFLLTTSLRARATVKIHDGCSHKCTYCIIPYTRGPSRSRNIREIIAEIRGLLERGYKEIVLSGINLRQFGQDFTFPMDFWDLIYRLEKEFSHEWYNQARFRISSLEPCQLDIKALDTLAQSKLICPHLHISLQSASNTVLKRMARSHYSMDMLYRAVEELKNIWNIFALGVDIITGFPGETEDDFIITQECLASFPFTYAHIFPFSERPFTKAPSMENQIYPHVRKERAKRLRSIIQKKHALFIQTLVTKGIPQYIVPEKSDPCTGISQYYITCKKKTSFCEANIPYIPIAYHDSYLDVE